MYIVPSKYKKKYLKALVGIEHEQEINKICETWDDIINEHKINF